MQSEMVEPVEVQLCSNLVQLLHLRSDCCCCSYSSMVVSSLAAAPNSKRSAQGPAAVFEAAGKRVKEYCHDDQGGQRKVMKRRPSRLLIPEPCSAAGSGFACDHEKEMMKNNNEFEVEGKGYSLAWRKGQNKYVMEDGYGVIADINDDPTQVIILIHSFKHMNDMSS